MPNVIFFAHDAGEPAIRRRIASIEASGARLTAFSMRRGEFAETPFANVDLGQTRDGAMGQRIAALLRALPKLFKARETLAGADVFYARNLDMLALAFAARALSGGKQPIVYECLDIHKAMTRPDTAGALMRAAEGALLARCALLVTSSQAFLREYFWPRFGDATPSYVLLNRMPAGSALPARPQGARVRAPGAPLTIGWFGNLRCKRSLALLVALADAHKDKVRIVMRGYPALGEIPDFEEQIKGRANIAMEGRYAWPADLARMYNEVDLVWAGDFHDADANSRWLLPNRIYEGGYFATPPIAPRDSETGRWINARGVGFTLGEPIEQTLPALIETISARAIAGARARLLQMPADNFVQPDDEIFAVLQAALRPQGVAATNPFQPAETTS